MSYRICLIEGDGIGREVIPAARRVLEALPLALEFVTAEAGWDSFQRTGSALPEATLEAVRSARATLFGAVSSPLNPVAGYHSPIVALRRMFNLFANLRPVISQPIATSRAGIDMLIVRENTEGLYAGRERATADEAVTERVITRRASERIVRLACQQALQRRKKVTIAHKANVLKATCGLFRQVAFEVAREFPDVQAEEALVDSLAMRLITEPERFDIIVTTNLFGDILSDEAAGLVGGLGLAPSANIGLEQAVFEPVHGSAPDIAGKGIANPLAAVLAAALLLQHLNEPASAAKIRDGVDSVIRAGCVTPDLGGTATTAKVTNAVIERIR
ncbi:MAG: isocitrate/isopropylmalate dehydrogenase family protein [Chloroflexi bacterium]|nr:isocitrate/isopropylmalate dehydrogenase family protein [Chloroflexota bacterium]